MGLFNCRSLKAYSTLSLDDRTMEEIEKYLRENAADRSGSKIGGKIRRNLGGEPPVRITEVPYIQKKHRGVQLTTDRRKDK
jgi:hypothetical protein